MEKDQRPDDLNICKMSYWLRESKILMEGLAMICEGVKSLKGP